MAWPYLGHARPASTGMKPVRRATTFLGALFSLLLDPTSARYLPSWVRSLLPGRTALKDQVPWVSFECLAWLKSHLRQSMVVFEYGSGGSTLFVSRRVGKLITVEHDEFWYRQVSSALSGEGISNCEYVLCKPEGERWDSYVSVIERYPDDSFDLVIVDGRARPDCMRHAFSKIRAGGYLLLDDSERQEYRSAESMLNGYKRTDFGGLCAYTLLRSKTTVWQKR